MSAPVLSIYSNELYSYLNELRLQQEFCDVIIKVGDRSFSCHRVILVSTMKYFRSMFSGKFNEANKGEIELIDVDGEDFELLLTFIYSGSVSFDEDSGYRLLKISHYLGLPGLENLCIDYLKNNADNISSDSTFNIFMYATTIENECLVEKFMGHIVKDLSATLMKYPKFVLISESYLLRILNNSVTTKDMPIILWFLAKWIQFQPSELKMKLLPDLLNAVNLQHIPSEWFLRAYTFTNDIPLNERENKVSNIKKDFADYIMDTSTLKNHSFNGGNNEACDDDGNDKIELPFIFYTSDHYHSDAPVESPFRFNLYKIKNDNELQLLQPLNDILRYSDLTQCKSVLVNGVPYSIFCRTSSNGYRYYTSYIRCKSKFYEQSPEYHPHEKTDSSYTSSLAIAACGTDIYVHNSETFLLFNCETNQWIEVLKNGLIPTAYSNLVSYDSLLYLVGGLSKYMPFENASKSKSNNTLFQHYDKREGKWTQMPGSRYTRCRSASCIHDDVLYVTGGDALMHYQGLIECFDFKACKWRELEISMPAPKLDHTLLFYNNQLYFFGGMKRNTSRPYYSPDNSWYSHNFTEGIWSDICSEPFSYTKYKIKRILDVVIDCKNI